METNSFLRNSTERLCSASTLSSSTLYSLVISTSLSINSPFFVLQVHGNVHKRAVITAIIPHGDIADNGFRQFSAFYNFMTFV